MQFTGRNLEVIYSAVVAAIAHHNTEIGLHPAPLEYPEDIEELEAEVAILQKMQTRILTSMGHTECTNATSP